jgi:hypothetical protein
VRKGSGIRWRGIRLSRCVQPDGSVVALGWTPLAIHRLSRIVVDRVVSELVPFHAAQPPGLSALLARTPVLDLRRGGPVGITYFDACFGSQDVAQRAATGPHVDACV